MANETFPHGTMRLAFKAFESLRELNQEFLSSAGYPGIGLTNARVIQHVVYSSANLSEIAKASKISRQAVSKAAKELEDAGFISLTTSPSNMRALEAKLTKAGKKLFDALRNVIQQSEYTLERKLGKRKLATLRKLLVEVAEIESV